ncbi:MAG: hypothetical protein ABIN91_19190 [Mucilaginibacter sp.]|uniref:hypothetical protein n=1 Tax=Mucilaginibacter sp. TaxID=1882438 RepID=UPI003264E5CB
MKKLKLQFGGIKEMLTKEQMKKINGGDENEWPCYLLDASGNDIGESLFLSPGDNCCQAQGLADAAAWGSMVGDQTPYGINCPCDIVC